MPQKAAQQPDNGQMKRIDRLILTSFLPPFVVAFSIALFVLLMQILWLYIDDIAGKGLGFFMIIELLFYRSVGIIPMALPLGMLLASVMVMGNLAERFELSSLKSAGISLLRLMRSLMVFGAAVSVFSWYCSNTLIPIANLKFGSRMYDIQQKKPALRLEEGVFNDDFQGFSMHIGKRKSDGRTVQDILIYDHTESSSGKLSEVVAKEGEMYVTPDGRYFVMQLRDGHQYIESRSSSSNQGRYPFVRTYFKEYTKIFDLSEFELSRTNESLFAQSRQMMTATQLRIAADSIGMEVDRRVKGVSNYMVGFISFLETDSTYLRQDSTQKTYGPSDAYLNPWPDHPEADPLVTAAGTGAPPPGRLPVDMDTITSIIQTFTPVEREGLYARAENAVRSILNQMESTTGMLDRMEESRVKHIFDLHSKYSIALACFIFLFIGAPMGAIIRRGGFGYPILVSIVFFMLFVVLTIFCRKITESFILTPEFAAWLPCLILFPIGLVLTVKAMNDSQILQMEGLVNLLTRLRKRFVKEDKEEGGR